MNRRVVVTGVGLVCGCGIGTEEVWRNLLAGKSGIGRVTQFDVSAFDCQIAGEVKNFDPLNWVEKKELKKMARFIQLAMAASDFAHAHGRPGNHAGNRGCDGRLHRIGHRRIRRDRARALEISERRPGQDLSLFHSCRNREFGVRTTFPSATEQRDRTRPRPRLAPLARTPSATPTRLSSAATRR